MGLIFTTISDKIICNSIQRATKVIIYVAPGLSIKIADEIIRFTGKNKKARTEIIIDPNPDIFRLGYGEIRAVENLTGKGITIRKSNNLRIGILVVDQQGYIFSPIPLLIEAEPTLGFNNALKITAEQAEKIVEAVYPLERPITGQLKIATKEMIPEIGLNLMEKADVKSAIRNLELVPPQKFDLARVVRVYNSYIQFVELSLKGCNLKRHTISIPPQLMGISSKSEIQERIRTTYRLINENSKISSKKIEDKIGSIRKVYIQSLGSKYGNVILKNKKEEFVKEMDKARNELVKFKRNAVEKLQVEFDKSKKELVQIFIPSVRDNPPDDLRGTISTKKPTKEVAEQYLEDILGNALPSAKSFVSEMEIQCYFKDVTYEMLNEKEFLLTLKKAYPYVEWPKPYEEYDAAREGIKTK